MQQQGHSICKKINLPVLDYCIAGHHAGLPDYGNTAERSSLCGRYKKENNIIMKHIKKKLKFQRFIQNRSI